MDGSHHTQIPAWVIPETGSECLQHFMVKDGKYVRNDPLFFYDLSGSLRLQQVIPLE